MQTDELAAKLGDLAPDRICMVADEILAEEALADLVTRLNDHFHDVAVVVSKLKAGESVKTTATLAQLWAEWNAQGLSRSSLVIAVGGGTITDVVGFAASTYKRGVRWVAVPTTLLCMVDAAIGGKTGINASGIKNLVGSFWPPVAVWTEPVWLKTLPEEELWNGWMEMAKHALVGDASVWGQTSATSPPQAPIHELFQWALRSAAFKQRIVANDPMEQGQRKILNFGHTLAHALEACSHDQAAGSERGIIPHGIAVGWGMCWALRWSAARTPMVAEELCKAEAVLRGWLANAHWGDRPVFSAGDLWQKMQGDKKNRSGTVLDVALQGIGEPIWDQTVTREDFESVWLQLA